MPTAAVATLSNKEGDLHYQFDIDTVTPFICMMHGLDGLDYAGQFSSLDDVPSEDLAMMIVYERYVDIHFGSERDVMYIATRVIDFVDEEGEEEDE